MSWGNPLEFQNAVSGIILFNPFICGGKLYTISGACFLFKFSMAKGPTSSERASKSKYLPNPPPKFVSFVKLNNICFNVLWKSYLPLVMIIVKSCHKRTQ